MLWLFFDRNSISAKISEVIVNLQYLYLKILEEDSIDKAFNDIACQEVTFANQGYSDGLISGSIKHCQEGYKLGLQKGFEIGSEVGNYRGFAIVSLKQISTQGPITKLSSKQQRCIKVLEKLLKSTEEFPSTNPCISEKIGKNN